MTSRPRWLVKGSMRAGNVAGLIWPEGLCSGKGSDQEPLWPDRVYQQEVFVGLDREGALADHPWRLFESIVPFFWTQVAKIRPL